MTDPRDPARADPAKVHGHTGPTTSAEDGAREAAPEAAPLADKAKIAEAASREEDA
jgi:hypothetical protein